VLQHNHPQPPISKAIYFEYAFKSTLGELTKFIEEGVPKNKGTSKLTERTELETVAVLLPIM